MRVPLSRRQATGQVGTSELGPKRLEQLRELVPATTPKNQGPALQPPGLKNVVNR